MDKCKKAAHRGRGSEQEVQNRIELFTYLVTAVVNIANLSRFLESRSNGSAAAECTRDESVVLGQWHSNLSDS